MPSYKILVKFKEKDNFVSAFGWGDMHNNYGDHYAAERENDKKYSKQAVVVSSKKEAWEAVAAKVGKSVSYVRKNYELRRRKDPYEGKKNVGEWVYDGSCVSYHNF